MNGGANLLFTEEQLKLYSKPLSESEKEKCENAIRIIQESLESLGYEIKKGIHRNNEDTLSYQIKMTNPSKHYELSIFVKGSYATNTNVRQNSDVDIAVVKESEFFDKYREGKTRENYKFISSNKPPYHFKDEVEEALIERFGRSEVRRGNKAIRINGNTYRKETDCVPCFRDRDYSNDYMDDPNNFIGGITIYSDKGERIINYPEQHINNSVIKNNNTNYKYKKMVRIIKEIRYQLIDSKNRNAEQTSSFGVEGLFWNIPDYKYNNDEMLGDTFNAVIAFLIDNIDKLNEFKEPNDILYLCDSQEKNNVYKNFILDVKNYFEYSGEKKNE